MGFGHGLVLANRFGRVLSMPRTFAYLRVSTIGQTTDNQREEIRSAGFQVEAKRVITETISGSVATSQRRGFTKLVDRLEDGDVLVVTKLDRLGRNAMDVGGTVAQLAKIGVRVHCLALGGVDLTSSTGKLTMGVINAVAEFERDLLIERTQAGLARARVEGKRIGRPAALTPERRRRAEELLRENGASAAAVARELGVGRTTIRRLQAHLSSAE
jgi:putative DNA-invertase from lambdoid prophage Rac